MSALAQLAALLSSLYEPAELRAALVAVDPALDGAVPWTGVARDEVASLAVGALERRGLVGAALFRRLRADRPGRNDEIALVELAFGLGPGAAPAAGPAPAPGPREQITLLHLSDPQFGPKHAFGVEISGPERWDSLLARLCLDLGELLEKEGLRPDVVAVTGDLAERGTPGEFRAFEAFARGLMAHLGLPLSRLLIVPGNHDISRPKAQAYFLECEAHEQQPVAPYWPKWEFYKGLFDRLYADVPTYAFTEEQPWTCYELPELGLVVAGLNATMAESHRETDHYGQVGEDQARAFADRLKAAQQRGWMRIGLVHHNVVRGAVLDDENLRDADTLRAVLRGRLNLLLHGHTHRTSEEFWGPRLPILGTGSAAVVAEARPRGVGNQLQILRLRADGYDRWCRTWLEDQRRWAPDVRLSDSGKASETIAFEDVKGTFAARAGTSQLRLIGALMATPGWSGRTEAHPGAVDAAVELDRHLQWSDVLTRSASQHDEIFLLHGSDSQDLGLFGDRVRSLLVEVIGPGHHLYTVPVERPGEIASVDATWESRFAESFGLELPAEESLRRATARERAFVLIGEHPLHERFIRPEEVDALVGFLQERLPAILTAEPRRRHPVRLYVAVEDGQEGRAGPLKERLDAALDALSKASGARYVSSERARFPSWKDVEDYVRGLRLHPDHAWWDALRRHYDHHRRHGRRYRDLCQDINRLVRALPAAREKP